jgi:serine/threonine protein kinase
MGSLDIRTTLDLSDIHADLTVPFDSLPIQIITGEIRGRRGCRCKIVCKEKPIHRGGQGIIREGFRTSTGASLSATEGVVPLQQHIVVKSPIDPGLSLTTEAIIQWLAAATLERRCGIVGAVAKVHDLYQASDETRFSMEFVGGLSAIEYIATAPTGEADGRMFQILAQTTVLLSALQRYLRLDHRDLKGDNIWIRPGRPVNYMVDLADGSRWQLESPFQVVILDFGFACIGGVDGRAIVNLSDGILPRIDPCPKEGRDMFQLLASFWHMRCVRERISAAGSAAVEELLGSKAGQAATAEDLRWAYNDASERGFRWPPLEPARLLKRLADNWKGVGVLHRL